METLHPWPWGVLPFAAPLVAWIGWQASRHLHRDERLAVRAAGAAVWSTVVVTASVAGLAQLGWLARGPLLATWVVLGAMLSLFRSRRTERLRPSLLHAPLAYFALAPAIVAVGLAVLAAYWLPIWQWDSLGYHLPYVQFLLQDGSAEGVPRDVPYLSTYPHDAELAFAGLRLLLPDDRLIDLGQIAFGLIGSVGIAALARQLGARALDAVIAGLAWLTVPAVFLQLPTNYVDVAAAAHLLLASSLLVASPRPATLVAAGAAIGLFLGTKPSAPLGASILVAVLFFRAWQANQLRWAPLALGVVILLGGGSYLENLFRHGNPVWPVAVNVGPLHLPGTRSMATLLDSGAGTYRLEGSTASRVMRSWTSLTAPPVFDMRVGGFGALVLLAFPFAAFTALRRRAWILIPLTLASVVAADPAVVRYVLGFPGLIFATVAVGLATRRPWLRGLAHALIGIGGFANLLYAAPGLTGEGPSLATYAGLTWAERAVAVGAEGPPTALLEARSKLRPGEAAGYDESFDLPYLLWADGGTTRVVRIGETTDPDLLERQIDREKIRLLAVDPRGPAGAVVRRSTTHWQPLFACRSTPCVVYWHPP